MFVAQTSMERFVQNHAVENIEGPCRESDFEAGLIARCWEHWRVPAEELSNEALAAFVRQQIVAAVHARAA